MAIDICVRVGLCIRASRHARGWTQQMLADHAQIERAHLARLETGKKEICLRMLDKIARALGMEAYQLLM